MFFNAAKETLFSYFALNCQQMIMNMIHLSLVSESMIQHSHQFHDYSSYYFPICLSIARDITLTTASPSTGILTHLTLVSNLQLHCDST